MRRRKRQLTITDSQLQQRISDTKLAMIICSNSIKSKLSHRGSHRSLGALIVCNVCAAVARIPALKRNCTSRALPGLVVYIPTYSSFRSDSSSVFFLFLVFSFFSSKWTSRRGVDHSRVFLRRSKHYTINHNNTEFISINYRIVAMNNQSRESIKNICIYKNLHFEPSQER